jgi:transketolase
MLTTGYLRLHNTVANESDVFSFSLEGSIRYRKGRDVTLLSTGGILKDVVEAAELLQKQGIDAGVVSMHSVKPIDKNAIISAANESGEIGDNTTNPKNANTISNKRFILTTLELS